MKCSAPASRPTRRWPPGQVVQLAGQLVQVAEPLLLVLGSPVRALPQQRQQAAAAGPRHAAPGAPRSRQRATVSCAGWLPAGPPNSNGDVRGALPCNAFGGHALHAAAIGLAAAATMFSTCVKGN